MAANYRKRDKYCGTCNLWGGMRDIKRLGGLGDEVVVDSPNTEGKCFHQEGLWKDHSKRAIDNCNKWEAWVVFR